MTEKTFTQKEINEITNKIFIQYHTIFQAERMSFEQWVLVKSIITDIQVALDGVDENDDDKNAIKLIDETIMKYHNSMTEDPSTTNHYCNNIIRDLKKIKEVLE